MADLNDIHQELQNLAHRFNDTVHNTSVSINNQDKQIVELVRKIKNLETKVSSIPIVDIKPLSAKVDSMTVQNQEDRINKLRIETINAYNDFSKWSKTNFNEINERINLLRDSIEKLSDKILRYKVDTGSLTKTQYNRNAILDEKHKLQILEKKRKLGLLGKETIQKTSP